MHFKKGIYPYEYMDSCKSSLVKKCFCSELCFGIKSVSRQISPAGEVQHEKILELGLIVFLGKLLKKNTLSLRFVNTGNNFFQLVSQHCCIVSGNPLLRVSPPATAICRATKQCCKLWQHAARGRREFYFLQQILALLRIIVYQNEF